MEIRKATLDDREGIKNLIREFHQESLKEFKLSFDWGTIDKTIENCIINHIVIVSVEDKITGIISGMVQPSMFDSKQLLGQELMWYITKEKRKGTLGIRLLRTFEEKCKDLGATAIIGGYMANLFSGILDRFYKINKYTLMEVQYIKCFEQKECV